MVDERIEGEIVVNIFTALMGIVSICALASVITRIVLSPKKVWDEESWMLQELEAPENYDQLRKGKPHIWMD